VGWPEKRERRGGKRRGEKARGRGGDGVRERQRQREKGFRTQKRSRHSKVFANNDIIHGVLNRNYAAGNFIPGQPYISNTYLTYYIHGQLTQAEDGYKDNLHRLKTVRRHRAAALHPAALPPLRQSGVQW
jgi:hypothetical protein